MYCLECKGTRVNVKLGDNTIFSDKESEGITGRELMEEAEDEAGMEIDEYEITCHRCGAELRHGTKALMKHKIMDRATYVRRLTKERKEMVKKKKCFMCEYGKLQPVGDEEYICDDCELLVFTNDQGQIDIRQNQKEKYGRQNKKQPAFFK